MATVKSIDLFYTEGSSDKQYRVTIVEAEGGFHVIGMNGRRGAALKSQPKTAHPVALGEANELYESLVREKTRKGYTPDQSGVAYAMTEEDGRVSGWTPLLLNAIDDEAAEDYVASDGFIASEKVDGERRGVMIGDDGAVRGMNRRGLFVPVPQPWVEALASLEDSVLDGEHVGDTLHVFDVVRYKGRGLSEERYEDRLAYVERVVKEAGSALIVAVDTARGEADKRALMERVREKNGEGIVFRERDSRYVPGRAPSAVSSKAVKLKFVQTATVIVTGTNGHKRSVAIGLLDEAGEVVPVGNVTIPPNAPMPKEADLVEVQFLYKYDDGGSLYQPVYLRRRDDLERSAATLGQVTRIKTKAQAAEEEEV